MRKVLIIVIILLLVALGYTMSFNGLEIGKFQIWSVKELSESSKSIDTKIEEINSLIDVQYPKKISDLKSASNNMKTAKEEYLNYTNLSSDEQILRAMQEESYSIEFLWTKIGNHATSEGVNSSSTGGNNVNDINFTVQGTYIGITNFIYAIENDQDLNFRIQNFKLVPDQGNILKGTFVVKNIAIQGNTSGQQSTTNVTETNNSNSASSAANQSSNTQQSTNQIQNTEVNNQASNTTNTTSTAQ